MVTPTSFQSRGLTTGEMFNRKGEVRCFIPFTPIKETLYTKRPLKKEEPSVLVTALYNHQIFVKKSYLVEYNYGSLVIVFGQA